MSTPTPPANICTYNFDRLGRLEDELLISSAKSSAPVARSHILVERHFEIFLPCFWVRCWRFAAMRVMLSKCKCSPYESVASDRRGAKEEGGKERTLAAFTGVATSPKILRESHSKRPARSYFSVADQAYIGQVGRQDGLHHRDDSPNTRGD